MDKTYVVVKVDATLAKRLMDYKDKTGIPITRSVNEAITDFLEVVVPARLDSLGFSQIDKKPTPRQKKLA